jgi:hypothetical protein
MGMGMATNKDMAVAIAWHRFGYGNERTVEMSIDMDIARTRSKTRAVTTGNNSLLYKFYEVATYPLLVLQAQHGHSERGPVLPGRAGQRHGITRH